MRHKTKLLKIAAGSAAVLTCYAALLCLPGPFFAHRVRAAGLALHSDQPLPEDAAKHVLTLAVAKLAMSPLYKNGQEFHVFICNARWRQMLFFNKNYGVGGVAYYPFGNNVFLRDALVAENRLISPRGTPVPGDRTLDYFIAHEIIHQVTGQAIGVIRFYQLPQWVREGYADYVGKGNSFHFDAARHALRAGQPELDFRRSGQYLRFHLFVAYLLDNQGWSLEQLLWNPPPMETVERAVRAD